MTKPKTKPDMLPEYDFGKGVRGKYAAAPPTSLSRIVPKKIVERRIAEQGLGIIQSLRMGWLSFEQAETDLFNLSTYELAKERSLNRVALDLLAWGMELEDVSEIAPEGLEESYSAIEKLARRILSGRKNKGHARSSA